MINSTTKTINTTIKYVLRDKGTKWQFTAKTLEEIKTAKETMWGFQNRPAHRLVVERIETTIIDINSL